MANNAYIISFFKKNIIGMPFEKGSDYAVGNIVIYKSEEGGEDAGKIVYIGEKEEEKILEGSCILRKATSHDFQKIETHDARKMEALDSCCDEVEKLALNMHVFDVSYSFDGKRLAFLFTAEERVDFRELVKKLASLFKKQIHLHQVGPRDRAKILGERGKCGKMICCKNWLPKLASITMDMVRMQGLEGKGGSKLSGVCGKLLCCLKYEVEEYVRMREGLPAIGSVISTRDGNAEVIGLDILNRKIKVVFEDRKFSVISDKDVKKIIFVPKTEEAFKEDEALAQTPESGELI